MIGRIANMNIITKQVLVPDPVELVNIIVDLSKRIEQLEKNQGSNETKKFFTQLEAMEYLRMKSRNTFKKYVKSGLIKIHGTNGERVQLFLKEDLDNFVKAYK
jgi:hypothetical protein